MKSIRYFGGAVGALLLLAGCGGSSSNTATSAYNPCDVNPASPACNGACSGNIYQPGCAGWGSCGIDPYAAGCAGNCLFSPGDSGCAAFSIGQGTKDTDLQQAQAQTQSLRMRAQTITNQFGMNFSAAVRLTALADQMNQLTANNQLTDADRTAIADAALAVAGISTDDESAAAAALIQNGDHTAVDNLMVKAAANLGMSSPATLRDEILPSLGINIPQ